MKRIDELVIISTERSGTNFLGACLRTFEGANMFFEVFGKDAVFGLDAYPRVAQRFGTLIDYAVEQETDPQLSKLVKEKPVKHLKLLNQSAAETGASFFGYKVFPNQVQFSKLKIALESEGVRVIFLVRRRIDCFISFKKALATGLWQDQDTTDKKIDIDGQEFLAWSFNRDSWFESLFSFVVANKIPRTILSYDADIDRPREELINKCGLLLKVFEMSTKIKDVSAHDGFAKQDKEDNPFNKISNGVELKEFLLRERRLDYALATALS